MGARRQRGRARSPLANTAPRASEAITEVLRGDQWRAVHAGADPIELTGYNLADLASRGTLGPGGVAGGELREHLAELRAMLEAGADAEAYAWFKRRCPKLGIPTESRSVFLSGVRRANGDGKLDA